MRTAPDKRLPGSSHGWTAKTAVQTRSASPVATAHLIAVCLTLATYVDSAAAASAADDHGEQAIRPNVLLLLSDDQRPDTVRAFGNRRIRTPSLDSLVRDGTTFRRAYCSNPICTPSRAEIMTGQSGFAIGIRDFGQKLPPGTTTWAGRFQQAGYQTAFVGKWHNSGLPADWGFAEHHGLYRGGGAGWSVESFDWNGHPVTGYRGWMFRDRNGAPDLSRPVGLEPNISATFASAAIRFLEQRDSSRPFLLQVAFTAPHDPLLMPIGFESEYAVEDMLVPDNFLPEHPFDHGNLRGRDEQLWGWPRDRLDVRRELAVYYATITHLDQQVRRVLQTLEELKLTRSTIVIFTSDHGLAIGSHGLRGKQNMYAHTVQVPLIMRGPGIPRNRQTDVVANLQDLFPTTAELAGIPLDSEPLTGRSLVPHLRGHVTSGERLMFGYFRDTQRMVTDGRWKLIWYPDVPMIQLFDLRADPTERHNLAGQTGVATVRKRLAKQLADWQTSVRDPATQIPADGAVGNRQP